MNQSRDIRLTERCKILAEVVLALRLVYHSKNSTPTQRQLIETIIGAAIWYLPQANIHWTGKISKSLTQRFHPDSGVAAPRMTQDHCYPRKLAAYKLLNEKWYGRKYSGLELKNLYDREFGKFNYISSEENRRLMPHQRRGKFLTTSKAYKAAKIELIKVNLQTLKLIKRRDRATIDRLIR